MLNKKYFINLITLILIIGVFLPFLSLANPYTPLIRCDGSTASPCNFTALIDTLNRIVNWIISMAGVVFTIMAIYGGFLYMRSGDNPGNKTKAKDILFNTLKGFVIILTAWLIVYTILKFLVIDGGGSNSILRYIGDGN